MKILVCVSEYPPHASGIGNVAYRMVREFEKKGHTCTVCSPTGPDIALGSRGMIQRFGGLGILYFWWRVSKYFADKADEWDTVWLHWPLFIRKCPFPSAVVTYHGTYRGFRTMARSLKSSLFLKGYYAFMESMERRCLRAINSDAFLFCVVSPHIASELASQGITGSSISYVAVGVDTEKFHPIADGRETRVELGIPAEALVLLYVGRLSYPKNLFTLVDTFAKLKDKLRQAVLLIVGDGELHEPLSRYIRTKNVPDIRLLGFIPNDELPRVYGCADFFIMASMYEGQPVALLEAMVTGLPPIVSNIPTMEQLVNESGAGKVVDFSSPAEAASQIEAYVASSKAREDRYRVREYVEGTMSSPVCAERYLELLGQVGLSKKDTL